MYYNMYAMNTKEFKKLTDAEIKEKIEAHKKWLENPQEGAKADFSCVDAAGENFSELDLRGANFNGAKLNGANFNSTKLNGADFSNTNLYGADFVKAKLNDANFNGSELRCADFTRANLSNATMTKCLLNHSNFIKANLHCTNLFDSLLDGADFKGANLIFSSAFSLSHQIYKANFDDDAILAIFYHTLMIVAKSKNISPELKSFLLTEENTKKANQYSEVKKNLDGKIYSDGTVGSYYEFNY